MYFSNSGIYRTAHTLDIFLHLRYLYVHCRLNVVDLYFVDEMLSMNLPYTVSHILYTRVYQLFFN